MTMYREHFPSSDTDILEEKTEKLSCVLSGVELQDRAKKLVAAHGKLDQHGAEEDRVKAALKSTRIRLENEIKDLVRIVRDGAEVRDVTIRTEAIWARGVKITVRADTGEVIEETGLNENERQRKFAFDDRRADTEKRLAWEETERQAERARAAAAQANHAPVVTESDEGAGGLEDVTERAAELGLGNPGGTVEAGFAPPEDVGDPVVAELAEGEEYHEDGEEEDDVPPPPEEGDGDR